MKKVLFAAFALIATAAPAMAEEDFAPAAGDLSLELQFDPFSDKHDTFSLERLQATYMLSDKDGLRFGLGLNVGTSKYTPAEEVEKTNTKNSWGDFQINLGYERHFFNYKRVDLYAGVEAVYTHAWAKTKAEKYNEIFNNNGDVVGSYIESVETKNVAQDKDGNAKRGGNAFAFNLFTGINFSIYKGLYVGAEIGLGFGFENNGWVQTVTDNIGNTGLKDKGPKTDKTSSFETKFYANPAFRLGWTF